jgi:putative two-component system response regulator
MQKAGPLTEEERLLMNTHPEIGENICKPLKSFGPVLPLIRHHHERLDGSGYPDGLKNGDIAIAIQILTMVDIYDALTSARPYREALSSPQAFGIIDEEVKRGWRDRSLARELEALIMNTNDGTRGFKGDPAAAPWG